MGAVQSQEYSAVKSCHSPVNVDPRSPCPEIVRTPLQVIEPVDKDDPRSPSANVMRTPIDKHADLSPAINDENRGERCPLLKHSVQVEKKSLLKEFNS